MFSRLLILLLLSSCSLFRGSEKLSSSDTLKNIAAIRLTGEGKGRLHIKERQYLFGVESVLKDDASWIMAVTIPLHGEEALIFPSLKESSSEDPAMESFAARIEAGIRENLQGSGLKARDFLLALRKTVRLLFAKDLGLPLRCSETLCELEGEEFQIIREEKSFRIITKFSGHELVTTASNLTGPFFLRTQFRVVPEKSGPELLILELFWSE